MNSNYRVILSGSSWGPADIFVRGVSGAKDLLLILKSASAECIDSGIEATTHGCPIHDESHGWEARTLESSLLQHRTHYSQRRDGRRLRA